MKTAGILTGGGDAPGLNAVLRAVVRSLAARGWRVLGIRHGWRGMVEGGFPVVGVPKTIDNDLSGTDGRDPVRLTSGEVRCRS